MGTDESIVLRPRRAGAIDRDIGARIAAERKARGLSSGDLARRLGFSPMQMSKYETGTSRIPAVTLLAISRIVGVPVARFLPERNPDSADECLHDIARHLPGIEDPEVLHALRDLIRALTAPGSPPPRSAPPAPRRWEIRSPCR